MANNALTFQLPLATNNSDPGGFLLIKEYKDLAKQHLKMVILTNPGERVMDPNFGAGVRQFLFEPSTSVVDGEIKAKVAQQVAKYIKYMNVLDIQISKSEDMSTAYLSIFYKILPLELIDEMYISWSLD